MVCADDAHVAPRDPEVAPPIRRSVNRASLRGLFRAQVAPTEPSGRRWTRGAGHCTPDVNLHGARVPRLPEACVESS